MATYKVIQDIEAEDKFVGPLTLKQFIFASAGILFGWLNFLALSKGAGWALTIFLPPMLLGFFLAFPWSKEQPTEVWVLAKLRFRLKPKVRIWNQDGLQELVTITAPKVEEHQLTDNLSQTEVKSRLKALADTIDSRGWAVKNAQVDVAMTEQTSDRLISPSILPKQVPGIDLSGVQDIMDDDASVSTNFEQMMESSDQIRREENIDKMDRVRHGEPLEGRPRTEIHLTQPEVNTSVTPSRSSLLPPLTVDPSDEASLAQELRERQSRHLSATGRMRDITAKPKTHASEKTQADMTSPPTPAIIRELSQNNSWNIDTVARQADKATRNDEDNEVVIHLR